MKVGIALNIAGGGGRIDAEVLREHLRIGDLVEPLGFDSIFAFEHHFSDYILSPCPTTLLSYFAGRTGRVHLGTAVIVLPWHSPIEVSERILLLDAISNGRGIFGFGMGRAVGEFSGLGFASEDAASRWGEALCIVQQALAGGDVNFSGVHFQVPQVSIRPRPSSSLLPSMYAAVGSVASAKRALNSGLGLFLSASTPRDVLKQIGGINSLTRGHSDGPVVFASVAIAQNRSEALDHAFYYFARDLTRTAAHYECGPTDEGASMEYVREEIARQIVGTAAECLEQLRDLREVTGADHFVFEVSYGGVPEELARRNLFLLASDVVPILRKW